MLDKHSAENRKIEIVFHYSNMHPRQTLYIKFFISFFPLRVVSFIHVIGPKVINVNFSNGLRKQLQDSYHRMSLSPTWFLMMLRVLAHI